MTFPLFLASVLPGLVGFVAGVLITEALEVKQRRNIPKAGTLLRSNRQLGLIVRVCDDQQSLTRASLLECEVVLAEGRGARWFTQGSKTKIPLLVIHDWQPLTAYESIALIDALHRQDATQ